jgi:hypothetical protein
MTILSGGKRGWGLKPCFLYSTIRYMFYIKGWRGQIKTEAAARRHLVWLLEGIDIKERISLVNIC